MKTISRYLTKEFIKYFGLILFIVLSIYLLIDFIEKIDDFMAASVPISFAIKYFLYTLPLIISQIIPVATLLSVLITFGLMSKNNELVALRAGGISLISLLGPVLAFGVSTFVGVLLMAEVVTPLTVPVANTIWSVQVQHQKVAVSYRKDFWLKAPKAIIHLKFYEADDQKASGVTIHRFDDHFNIIRRIDADSAVFRNGKWELVHGIEQIFEPKSEEVVVHSFDTRMVSLDLLPEDLAKVVPRADEMNFSQLYEYVKKIEAEGYDAIRYRVDMQGKFAFPFVCIIMALIGAGLAGRGKIKEGLPISISYGIGIAFLYWVAYSFCVSLGYADKLPPIVAVWVVNFIWLILAVYLLINAE